MKTHFPGAPTNRPQWHGVSNRNGQEWLHDYLNVTYMSFVSLSRTTFLHILANTKNTFI
jgi:hypothetical protein